MTEFELGSRAAILLDDLQRAGREGRVNYQTPITAKRICARYKEMHGWELSDVDIRDMVNLLRKAHHRIGSSTGGYWWMDKGDEGEDHVANQLESRLIAMVQAYAGMFPDRVNGLMTRLDIQAKRGKG